MESPLNRFTAVLAAQEILNLEGAFAELGGFNRGTLPLGTYTQEYVIEVSTTNAECYKELPFSKKTIMPILVRLRACLNDQSKHPIGQAIRQVEGWVR